MAQQVVQLAFEFARQQADSRSKQKLQTPAQGGVPSQYQSLAQLAEKADQEVQETQAEIPPLQKKLETAPAGKRAGINALIAETQSEVALFSARRDALRSMAEFASGASGNGAGASGLREQIEELARSVPSNLSSPSNTTPSQNEEQDSVKTAPIANREPPSGIWGLSADLFRLSRKEHVLKQDIAATDALIQSSKGLRAPLVTKLKGMINAGDQLAKEADTSSQAGLDQERQQLDKLTADFRSVAAAILPLSKQGIVLDLYKRSLANWKDSTHAEFKSEMRNLLARLGVLLVVIFTVFILGEVWRRTIFRYVHDVRRRYQFLLLRRIVLWVVIALIIAFTFATQLGSVVTFAGIDYRRRCGRIAERNCFNGRIFFPHWKIWHSRRRPSTGFRSDRRGSGYRTGAFSSDGSRFGRSADWACGCFFEFDCLSASFGFIQADSGNEFCMA